MNISPLENTFIFNSVNKSSIAIAVCDENHKLIYKNISAKSLGLKRTSSSIFSLLSRSEFQRFTENDFDSNPCLVFDIPHSLNMPVTAFVCKYKFAPNHTLWILSSLSLPEMLPASTFAALMPSLADYIKISSPSKPASNADTQALIKRKCISSALGISPSIPNQLVSIDNVGRMIEQFCCKNLRELGYNVDITGLPTNSNLYIRQFNHTFCLVINLLTQLCEISDKTALSCIPKGYDLNFNIHIKTRKPVENFSCLETAEEFCALFPEIYTDIALTSIIIRHLKLKASISPASSPYHYTFTIKAKMILPELVSSPNVVKNDNLAKDTEQLLCSFYDFLNEL